MYVIKYINESDHQKVRVDDQIKDKPWVTMQGRVLDKELILKTLDMVVDDVFTNYNGLSPILMHRDFVITGDPSISTMATDGISIFISPGFVQKLLDKDEDYGARYVEYVIMHEALHCLFDHMYESLSEKDEFPDFYKTNIAQDIIINYVLENLFYEDGELPFEGIHEAINGWYDERYAEYDWQDVYRRLPENIRKPYVKQKLSPDMEKGFINGYNKAMEILRKKKLVEHYEF